MERSQGQKKLVRCMRIELQAHAHTGYGSNCPQLWGRIFARFWNDLPEDSEDPRWDIILHELRGLKLLNQYVRT